MLLTFQRLLQASLSADFICSHFEKTQAIRNEPPHFLPVHVTLVYHGRSPPCPLLSQRNECPCLPRQRLWAPCTAGLGRPIFPGALLHRSFSLLPLVAPYSQPKYKETKENTETDKQKSPSWCSLLLPFLFVGFPDPHSLSSCFVCSECDPLAIAGGPQLQPTVCPVTSQPVSSPDFSPGGLKTTRAPQLCFKLNSLFSLHAGPSQALHPDYWHLTQWVLPTSDIESRLSSSSPPTSHQISNSFSYIILTAVALVPGFSVSTWSI